ncbi:hypothetical protein L917_19764 [Phytophthora nicotianae]|uniref:Tc1-like transposase DDE domain-containing protein n=1 Tax=Phytophthora nicotianae TaxID=4792 RepID=W2K3B5_PHYNI|nr:hypothetical protein L917_19764 [Phytophthora nicotianae]
MTFAVGPSFWFTSTECLLNTLHRSLGPKSEQFVGASVTKYVQEHPTFYFEELREHIIEQFPTLPNVSSSTLCRGLNFDLNLIRKVLEKAVREAIPAEIQVYRQKLLPLYSNPEQLVFLDETAKDRRQPPRALP